MIMTQTPSILVCFLIFSTLMVFTDAAIGNFSCRSDMECVAKAGAGTVCLGVESFGTITRKCAGVLASKGSTIKQRLCRGSSFGQCPNYQPPSYNNLVAQCVFFNYSNVDEIPKDSACCEGLDPSPNCLSCFSIKNITYVGAYKCVAPEYCDTASAFPEVCNNDACMTEYKQTMCYGQGTCTQLSEGQYTKAGCMCYPGFVGKTCDKVLDDSCIVDCGKGGAFGTCVKNKCVCKEFWNSNEQCQYCTDSLACENNGTCDAISKSCTCQVGYLGPTCGGKVHACVNKTCGLKGNCGDDFGNCYCPICNPECQLCEDDTCSTCSFARKEFLPILVFLAPLTLFLLKF